MLTVKNRPDRIERRSQRDSVVGFRSRMNPQQIALKLLPDAVSHEPERLARFEREARPLASLNHPKVGVRGQG